MKAPTNRILQIETRNFRGAPDGVIEIHGSGFVASGRNGAGKTSIVRALRVGIGTEAATADAVRLGADEAVVIVRTEDWFATRRILRADRQPPVKVETTGKIAANVKSPQGFLDKQVSRGLDPLAFYLADAKARRGMVLAALPLAVSEAQLRTYDPTLPEGYECKGHALEVIERRRDEKVSERKPASAAARTAREKAAEARAVADTHPVPASDFTLADATAGRADVERALREKLAGIEARATAEQKATATREKIAAKRAEAIALEGEIRIPTPPAVAFATDRASCIADIERYEVEIRNLQELLADKRAGLAEIDAAERRHMDATRAAQATQDRVADLRAQAAEAEAMLTDTLPECATEAQVAEVRELVETWRERERVATEADQATKVRAYAARMEVDAVAAEERAAGLDTIVHALAKTAPRELLAASDGIPGLGLDGDVITLNGVSLDGRCGAEQLRFAVDLAKRIGADAPVPLLTIDGLERIDDEHVDDFLEYATRDGWQLAVSWVQRGDLVIRQIEAPSVETVPAPAAVEAAS